MRVVGKEGRGRVTQMLGGLGPGPSPHSELLAEAPPSLLRVPSPAKPGRNVFAMTD